VKGGRRKAEGARQKGREGEMERGRFEMTASADLQSVLNKMAPIANRRQRYN